MGQIEFALSISMMSLHVQSVGATARDLCIQHLSADDEADSNQSGLLPD